MNFVQKYCTHTQGDLMGQKIVLMPFHRQMLLDVFGTMRTVDGLRRYTFVYQEIPKKNAKSTILAAIALYMTGYDNTPGAEVIVVAGGKEQARIIHNSAKMMVQQNAELAKVFDCYTDAIHHRRTNSVFRVLSADSGTAHGPNISCVIFDELHVQGNDQLWETLTKGVASRKQPLVFALTTAGFKGTFAHDISNAAYRIFMKMDKSEFWYVQFFGIRDELRAMRDFRKEGMWKEANPGYGITVHKTYFQTQMEEIKKRPSALTGFLRLHLNVWTGTSSSWDILPYLDGCNKGELVEADFEGRICWGGLDLARVGDTSALAWLFPTEVGDGFDVLVRVWIPEATMWARMKDENTNWRQWQAEGWVRTTPGNVVDQDVILADILEDAKKFKVFEDVSGRAEKQAGLFADPYGAWQIVPKLQVVGVPIDTLAQNPRNLCPPFSYLERMITAGKINFGGNPVLAWQFGNVETVTLQHDNRMPSKKDSKARIDIVSALDMAFAAYLPTTVEKTGGRSIYEDAEMWQEQ